MTQENPKQLEADHLKHHTIPDTPVPQAGSSQHEAGHSWPFAVPAIPSLFAVVFIAVLSLYGLTLAPGVVGGDAGEHQFAVPLLGIPHATGYPLYVLAGKLWTLLIPFGSLAWRMNLFSAVAGALAAATTAVVVYTLLRFTIYDLRFTIYPQQAPTGDHQSTAPQPPLSTLHSPLPTPSPGPPP